MGASVTSTPDHPDRRALMRIDLLNGDSRDALAFAALATEGYFVGLVKAGDRRVVICAWEGRRCAVLLQHSVYDQTPELAGALTHVALMTPELIPAPPEQLHYFADPALAGCDFLVHEDEARPPRPTPEAGEASLG